MTRFNLCVAIFCAAVTMGAAPGPLLAVVVDCSTDTVQAHLDLGETFIEVHGSCAENVTIEKDGTTIIGTPAVAPNPDSINGLFVSGVQRVLIDNLTVDGPTAIVEGSDVEITNSTLTGAGHVVIVRAHGRIRNSTIDGKMGYVAITNGASALIENSTITNTNNGMQILWNASLLLINSTLGPALIDDGNASCNPICIGDNSFARIQDTAISGNTNDPVIGAALSLFRDASVVLRGDNSVENTGSEPAIALFHNSSLRQDNSAGPVVSIDGDVLCFGMSYCDIRNAVISGDVDVDLHSVFRFRSTPGSAPSTITGNVSIRKDSAIDVVGPSTAINGDVMCEDRESSISGSFVALGRVRCSGF